jgi:hypothetical protein
MRIPPLSTSAALSNDAAAKRSVKYYPAGEITNNSISSNNEAENF